MDAIKLEAKTLLEKVKKNRTSHHKIFAEALEGYRMQAIEILERRLADAKAGKKIYQDIVLSEPVSQIRDYDRVIAILENTSDQVVELSESDFAQYWMDDWSWTQRFLSSNAQFSRRAQAALTENMLA